MAFMFGSTLGRDRLVGACAFALLSSIAAKAMAGPESTPKPPRSATSPAVELDPVTVEAQRRRALVDKQVSEFVYSIAGSARVESLARWNVPVCVATAGLTAAEADFVKQRVMPRTEALGAEIAADAVPQRPGLADVERVAG